MKRLSLILFTVFAFCLSSFAEVMQFKTTSYAFAEVNNENDRRQFKKI